MSEMDEPSPAAAILIIEDDDVVANRLQTGLLGAGFAVRRARSAEEALPSLASMRADLILMALMLPDTDGLILCSTLRARSAVPIILLSPRVGEVDRALAMHSGAGDLIATAVDVNDLLVRLQALRQGQPMTRKTVAGSL